VQFTLRTHLFDVLSIITKRASREDKNCWNDENNVPLRKKKEKEKKEA
jgi:hypothetical protein